MKTFLIAFLCLPMWAQQSASPSEKKQHSLPSEDRIQLLLTQSERAFDGYELAIAQEGQAGGKVAQAVAKDREVLGQARTLIAGLKKRADLFDGPAGFLLVGTLDDASRNMAVCSGQAGMESGSEGMGGNFDLARERLHLVQTCLDASNLLYTVSETAFDMYSEALLANDDMMKTATSTLEQCVNTLKENSNSKQ